MNDCVPPAKGGSWQDEVNRRAARIRKSLSLPKAGWLSRVFFFVLALTVKAERILEMGNGCDEIIVAESAKCAGKYCAETPVLVDARQKSSLGV